MTKETIDTADANVDNRYSACLLFSANALARVITAIGDEEFGRLGLAYSHAYLLREVVDQPGVTPTQLSNTLFLTPSTITRLIEKLEQKQLVERRAEGKNTKVFPTIKGEQLRDEVVAAWLRTWDRYSNAIGEEQVKTLTQQIFKAAQSLGAV